MSYRSLLGVGLLLGGCTGLILDPSASPSREGPKSSAGPTKDDPLAPPPSTRPEAPGGPADPPPPTSPPIPPTSLGASGVRRLSRAEYGATIKLLLGPDAPVQSEQLPLDKGAPFDNDADEQVPSSALVEATEALADELAIWAVATPARLSRLLPCTPTGFSDRDCFQAFVTQFGRRAFRRPLSTAERDAFLAFAAISTEDQDFGAGVRYALAAFLAHPAFLYRLEESGSGRALNDFELATRLSFLLTGRGPDEALLDRAAAGFAADPARVREVARELLASPAARVQLDRLHAMWLGYDRFTDEGIYGAMRAESNALVERVVYEDRSYLELFSSRETWLTPSLAEHYGLPSLPEAGWVTPPDTRRAGILAHASVLAASSNTNDTSPTRRGKFIRERLLCEVIPPPPPGVDVDKPPEGSTPGACKEQRYAEHRSRDECKGCHALMDPIGFGLEQFDKLGRTRTHDEGRPECPIDGIGSIQGVGDFSGPAALGALLSGSNRLESCVSKQLLGYALGRKVDLTRADDRAMAQVLSYNFGREHRLQALLLDLVSSAAFRARLDSEGP